MRIGFLPDPRGLYVLKKDGRLGVYDEQKRCRLDAELTSALKAHNLRLLGSYLRGDETESIRIGFVYPTRKPRPWGPVTMFLEDSAVRRLYPTDALNAPFTAFQKQNQEKSIYRGLELLLEYRSKEARARFYCPVLFDRGRMLNQYVHCLGRVEENGDATTPVIEVINLMAGLSLAERTTPTMHVLEEKLYAGIVRKDQRRPLEFAVVEAEAWSEPSAGMTDFYGETRAERIVMWSGDRLENLYARQDPGAPPVVQDTEAPRTLNLSAASLDKLYARRNLKHIDRYKENPRRLVTPDDLRRFTHFRELDRKSVELLASKTLIYTAPARARLLEHGMADHWNLYLLEGKLTLTAEDGQTLTIEGGSAKTANPIASLKPRKYTVTSATKVRFLWIPDAVFRATGMPPARSPGSDPQRSHATERKGAGRDPASLTGALARLRGATKPAVQAYSELDADTQPMS